MPATNSLKGPKDAGLNSERCNGNFTIDTPTLTHDFRSRFNQGGALKASLTKGKTMTNFIQQKDEQLAHSTKRISEQKETGRQFLFIGGEQFFTSMQNVGYENEARRFKISSIMVSRQALVRFTF